MAKGTVKSIRLNKEQMDFVNEKMKELNMTFSELIIYHLTNQNKSKRQKIKIANRDLILELAKIGNNLNQIAKKLNQTNKGLDRVGLEIVSEIRHHCEALRLQYDY